MDTVASMNDRTAWFTVIEWLDDNEASVGTLQKELLRIRLQGGDSSRLLAKALLLVAEATSAHWPVGAVRTELARLVDPLVLTRPTAYGGANCTTVSVPMAVSPVELAGIRVA